MAIAFRAAGTAGSGTTTASPGLPAGTAQNDILICVASGTGNTAFTWGGGGTWTEIVANNMSGTRRMEIRWSRWNSGDAAPTVTLGAANVVIAQIAGYSGCLQSGTPVDQTGTVTTQSSTTVTYAAITPTVANTELILAGGYGSNGTTSGYTGTNPTPTEQFDSTTATGSTAAVHLASGAKNDTTSSGSRTATRVGSTISATLQFNLLPAVITFLDAAATLAGTGTLTATAEIGMYAAAALTGTGTLTGSAVGAASGAATLTGTGTLTASASLTYPDAPPLNYGGTIVATPETFQDRWETGLHVGDVAPRMVVEVRRGSWDRSTWTIDPEDEIDATIGQEEALAPWMAVWDPAEDWLEVPGIVDYSETQSFDENGCQVVTLTMDNVRFTQESGATSLPYRALQRGFASPTRGFDPAGRTDDGLAQNEWYDRLSRMAQIRVWQGYGDPVRDGEGDMPADGGENGMWVFMGQIDDIDPADTPDRITITARNGQPLTDQEFFGWSKSSTLPEPVVFADRATYTGEDRADRWILVDDVADIVRVILRWSGYLDMAIETTGVTMKGKKAYNRQNKLIEAINDVCEQTGYSFFFAPPLDGDSQALPVFRMNGARDAAPVGMTEITENNLLTGVEYKQSMAPLAYIIRVRGKKADADDGGTTLGGQTGTRIMSVYRPPWSFQPGDPEFLTDRLGRLLKHVTLTRPQLKTEAECETFAKLLALNEALEAVQAVVEIPGHPGFLLDHQVGVTDSTLAINSRMWIAGRSNTFTTGEQTSWKTTLTGPLLDFPDVAAMIEELEE